MKRTLILSLAVSLICIAGLSQQLDKAKLDAYFDTLTNNDRFMGSVAVSLNEELVYTKSVGFEDVEKGLKADENSKYRIASISKTFTSVLVFIAIEENKLKLEQTIDKFFPAIKNADKISINHLLCHRSGIPDYLGPIYMTEYRTVPKTDTEIIEVLSKLEGEFEPDFKTMYSNSNFILLTYILERIYQKPYADILKEKITIPIGLGNTYLGEKINTKNNECNSYIFKKSDWEQEPETDISLLLGAGGIVSTAIDLTKFSEALFDGKLISPSSLKKMKTVKGSCEFTKFDLGMGLIEMPFDGNAAFGHLGGVDGFRTAFVYFPESSISFAFVSNGIRDNYLKIATVVLQAIFNKPFNIPEYKQFEPYHIANEDLDKFLGEYSSVQFPLKIHITKNNGKLFGQATGQTSFPLEAIEQYKFKFEQADITMEFNPTDKTMVFKQSGKVFNYVKEEFKTPNVAIEDENLDKYLGVYSSVQIPLKLTITKVNGQLFGQATGQSPFPLEETGQDKFKFEMAGIIMEFNPTDKKMAFKQGGGVYHFVRED